MTTKNLCNCSHFGSCSQNLCPLDFDLRQRIGFGGDKCRYMRDARRVKFGGKEFVSGGTAMPDTLLNLVPQGNLKALNEPSKKRWLEINNKTPSEIENQPP